MRRKDGQSNTSASAGARGGKTRPDRDLPARRFRFLPGDAVVIGAVAVVCVILLLLSWIYGKSVENRGRVVRITQDGNVILERNMADFSEPTEYRITSDSGEMVILLSSDKVYVKDSSCPDKICMHVGELKKSGDGAVCLPNRVVIQIVSSGAEEDQEVDVVAK